MAERKKITLIYQYNENWIGGTYYVLNIIRAFSFLDKSQMPEITVVHDNKSSLTDVHNLNYPYLNLVSKSLKLSLVSRMINKISSILFKKYFIQIDLPGENIYPVDFTINTNNKSKYYFWIPDFQEKYLPQFFDSSEITNRKRFQDLIAHSEQPVVFSSENAKNDFDKFYPNNGNQKVVLRFVSIIDPSYLNIDIHSLLKEKKIDKPFFIVSNQFWKHKNHFVILNAIMLLVEKGIDCKVTFTGKEYDNRNPEYSLEIREFVKNNNLDDHVAFLGFISREEQLALMKASIAIIQPSLFEGWSTVVEDSKALDQFIILSDIPLHREQIAENCAYFNPNSPTELADLMLKYIENKPLISSRDYNVNIVRFAELLLSIF